MFPKSVGFSGRVFSGVKSTDGRVRMGAVGSSGTLNMSANHLNLEGICVDYIRTINVWDCLLTIKKSTFGKKAPDHNKRTSYRTKNPFPCVFFLYFMINNVSADVGILVDRSPLTREVESPFNFTTKLRIKCHF